MHLLVGSQCDERPSLTSVMLAAKSRRAGADRDEIGEMESSLSSCSLMSSRLLENRFSKYSQAAEKDEPSKRE